MAELKSSRVTVQKNREVELYSRRSVVLQKRKSGRAEVLRSGRRTGDGTLWWTPGWTEDILQCTWSDYMGLLGNRGY